MGRPRKYHTAEEKRIAGRAKSKRYYEKNRVDILKRRHRQEKVEPDPPLPSQKTPEEEVTSMQYCVKLAKRLTPRLHQLWRGGTEQKRLDDLCSAYLSLTKDDIAGAKALVSDYSSEVSHLRDLADKYWTFVYELEGVGENLAEVEKVRRGIKAHFSNVEEIYIFVLTGVRELYYQFQNKKLAYQNL
ncbi:hypothetical protein FA15DRAFT_710678 [Coprinopsis marcescibilis]|uniref:Uncharacterized protein n=1 Tax=Coprinopsis marcescibilis TaxID=230819 RepID=A0A5C3KCS7_COPMA|nr:hypothetical protein FA15DRAFT_710678 [Coprinopsis marcescibilis]